MARFRFTLQALLDQRERIEEDRRRDVASIEAVRLDLQRSLDAAQARTADERAQWRTMLGATRPGSRAGGPQRLDLGGARRQAFAIVGIVRQVTEIQAALARVEKELEAARAKLVVAAKDRKAMELLRDQRLEAWRREEARAEAAMLDDISMARQARRAASGDEQQGAGDGVDSEAA